MRPMVHTFVSDGMQRRQLLAWMGTGLVALALHTDWGG
jgi:hypothetical protein